MAQTTYPPDADEDRDELRAAENGGNPGQAYYDREFNDMVGRYGDDPEDDEGQSNEAQGEPDNRPDLRSDAGLRGSGASDHANQAKAHRKKSKAAGAIPTTDLRDAENDALNYTGGGKKDGSKKDGSKGKGPGWWTKRKVGFAAAIISTGLFGSVIGLSVLSGPFELIHIAKLMERAHFSNLTDASDSRVGKLYRFLKYDGDASQTKLGYWANKYKNTMLGQLEDKGMTPSVGRFATLDGWNIDTKAESKAIPTTDLREAGNDALNYTGSGTINSPFEGMDENQLHDYLIENGVSEGSFDIVSRGKGIFSVIPKSGKLNVFKTYANQKGLLKFAVVQANESKIPNALRWRWLGKAYGVTWHPFVKLKGWLNNKVNNTLLKAWKAAREKLLKTGQGNPDTVNTENSKEKTTDSQGKTTTTDVGGGKVSDPSGFTKGLQNIKKAASSPGGKIAGGLAAAVGLICLFKTVSNNIGDIRYTDGIVPIERLAAETDIEGNQTQTNRDVDLSEQGVVAQQFYDPGTKTDWSDSKPVQAASGLPQTGADVDPGIKGVLNESPPSWLSWTDNPIVGTVCSTGGQLITGIASFTLGIFSGEAATTLIGAVVSAFAVPHAVSFLTNLATNNIVDVTKVAGAAFGGVVDFGSVLWQNSQAAGLGAVPLPTGVLTGLNTQENIEQTQQFEHESLAYRLFNPYDDRTLISKFIDNTTPSPSANMVNLADGIMGMGQTLLSLPMNLFSSVVSAENVTTYKYPFATWGFSPQDLTSPLVADPYENAGKVATLLDNNGQNGEGDYIGKAAKCFGVNIQKVTESNGKQDWDVIPNGTGLNLYNNTANTNDYYDAAGCTNPTDAGITSDNWLRLRFFIFDTGEMAGWACEHGDDQACQDDGVSQTATVSAPIGGNITINDAAAQSIIAKSGATVGYAVYDADGDQLASYQGTTENYGASITKAMLLVAYLDQVGTGTLSSQAKTELTNMIENSDNASANWVYSQLNNGPDQVQSIASGTGMSGFQFDTSDKTYVLGQSQITANDFASFFAKIDTYMPAAQKSFGMDLLSHLSSADQTGLLQAGLPGTVYSKEGWKPEASGLQGAPYVVNQAAQFQASGTTYGVAVTVGGTKDQASGEALIKQVVQALVSTSGN